MKQTKRFSNLLIGLLCLSFNITLVSADPTAHPAKPEATPILKVEEMYGVWEAKYNHVALTIEFMSEGKLKVGEGNEFKEGTYTVDLTTTPHQLTLMIDQESGFTLCEKISKDSIKIAPPKSDKFPTEFSTDSLVFNRQTSASTPVKAVVKAVPAK